MWLRTRAGSRGTRLLHASECEALPSLPPFAPFLRKKKQDLTYTTLGETLAKASHDADVSRDSWTGTALSGSAPPFHSLRRSKRWQKSNAREIIKVPESRNRPFVLPETAPSSNSSLYCRSPRAALNPCASTHSWCTSNVLQAPTPNQPYGYFRAEHSRRADPPAHQLLCNNLQHP